MKVFSDFVLSPEALIRVSFLNLSPKSVAMERSRHARLD